MGICGDVMVIFGSCCGHIMVMCGEFLGNFWGICGDVVVMFGSCSSFSQINTGTLPTYTGTLPIVYKLVPRLFNRRALSVCLGILPKTLFHSTSDN